MESYKLAIKDVVCTIRPAIEADVTGIRTLIRSSGFHSASSRKGKKRVKTQHRNHGRILSRILSPLFSSKIDWQDYIVVVSEKDEIIGCVKIKQIDDVWEVAKIAIEKSWRGRGILEAGCKFVFDFYPYPLWGMCVSSMLPLYRKLGAVEITEKDKIPPHLRRRMSLFNIILRVSGKKQSLSVINIDK
ncbi:MAG: GNAT family N-acetyltransferase [Candidatus Latescibacteria bacterium]|nr:GNAT family N-acetyltransferase [Candidatus Latescibacterota bacterium]